jgi:hypothetical protein
MWSVSSTNITFPSLAIPGPIRFPELAAVANDLLKLRIILQGKAKYDIQPVVLGLGCQLRELAFQLGHLGFQRHQTFLNRDRS